MIFIHEHSDRFAVALLLRVLGVAESTYYAWRKQAEQPCDRDLVDVGLLSNIHEIWEASGRTYGADRVHRQLGRDGIQVGRKRVERLMRQQGWQGAFLRRGWRGGSTRQDPRHTPAPDLVNRHFTAPGPNRLCHGPGSRAASGSRAGPWPQNARQVSVASIAEGVDHGPRQPAPTHAGTHGPDHRQYRWHRIPHREPSPVWAHTSWSPAGTPTAVATIDAETGRRSVTFVPADHPTVGGNYDEAGRVRAHVSGLNVLVNKVGGLFDRRWETGDGYEATLAMNFVGPYALTAQLLPLLRAAAPAQCVTVVTAGFKMCRQDPFEDLQSTHVYVAADASTRAKLLNLLCSLALAYVVASDPVTVNAVHPRLAWTQMTQAMTPQTMPDFRRVWPLIRLLQQHSSPDKASRRVALLASSPAVNAYTGRYFQGEIHPKRLSAGELGIAAQRRALQFAADLVAGARTGTGGQTNDEELRPRTPR